MTKPEQFGKWLHTIVERATDGYILVDPQGNVGWANSAARAILAVEEEPFLGTPTTRWIPEIDPRSLRQVSEVETDAISAKDDYFPIEIAVLPIDDVGGYSWLTFRDITRRRGFEGSVREHASELERMVRARGKELENARLWNQRLYDLAPVLDFELDSQGAIANANRKSCLSLGVTFDRLVGLPLGDLAVPDKRPELQEALTKMQEGSSAPFETRLRSANGSVLDVILHPCKPEVEGRSSIRIIGVDVTARREAERLVDQSLDLAEAQRARMERILRGIGEGVVVMDPDGQVRLMNQIAEGFLTIDERYAFGRDLLSEQADGEFVERWQGFVHGEEPILSAELNVGPPSGRSFAATISRIRTPEGRPAGCVCVLRDVTAERRVDQMKRDFVSNITHELRTPLASIRGFTTTILRGEAVAAEESTRFLEIIDKEAERLQHLIEDLLALSSLEAGREALALRPSNLSEILMDAHSMFLPVAKERDITMALEASGQNGAGIFDPDKIRRVLDNLIGNAMKFTGPGGRIEIRLERKDDRLICSVRDNGKGIEPEMLGKIFDRFYSVSPTQGNPWGTGLGLHICRRLVELHGGKIEATSPPGQGSTFRFWIDAVPRAKVEPKPEPQVADTLLDDEESPEPSGLAGQPGL